MCFPVTGSSSVVGGRRKSPDVRASLSSPHCLGAVAWNLSQHWLRGQKGRKGSGAFPVAEGRKGQKVKKGREADKPLAEKVPEHNVPRNGTESRQSEALSQPVSSKARPRRIGWLGAQCEALSQPFSSKALMYCCGASFRDSNSFRVLSRHRIVKRRWWQAKIPGCEARRGRL